MPHNCEFAKLIYTFCECVFAFFKIEYMLSRYKTHYCKSIIGRAKRAPHWGVQSRFRVIYIMYVGRRFVYNCLWETHTKNGMPKCMGGITWSKHAHATSHFCDFETKCRLETLILPSSGRSKSHCDIRIINFYYMLD